MLKHEADVLVEDLRWDSHFEPKKVDQILITTLNHLGIDTPIEVTVLMANDEEIQKLNVEFRGKDKPTNVLSFPSFEPAELENINKLPIPVMIGDIALAFETIMDESLQQSKTFDAHTTHLIVHGLLHLLGYDHEVDEEADVMESLEVEILNLLSINNPYE